MANGVSGVTISGGLNHEFNTSFIGYYENDVLNSPGILTQDYFGGRLLQANNSYFTYTRGNFVIAFRMEFTINPHAMQAIAVRQIGSLWTESG